MRSAAAERLCHRCQHRRLRCPEPERYSPTGNRNRAVARRRSIVRGGPSEISEVLARPKFARVLADDRRREILELLTAAALWVEPETAIAACRDPKDNRYLELALAAGATAIVSGDEDLLVLDPWRDIRVLRPAQFLEEFRPAES